MATRQWYEKVSETDQEVQFRYGYPELNRGLIIDKVTVGIHGH